MVDCIFCKLDALTASEAERCCAYYAVGLAGQDAAPPCKLHMTSMILGAALLGQAYGAGSEAEQLRNIVRGDAS